MSIRESLGKVTRFLLHGQVRLTISCFDSVISRSPP